MTEFIGARISLVSRSDIRYVGTLHEINSETSTVALENVTSFGTEGRKTNPEEEIPPSDSVYEYIVFRGSDVKDLRIEEAPAAKENKPPQVPNDPAILGSGSRPTPQAQPQRQPQATPQGPTQAPLQGSQVPQGPQGFQQSGPGVPPFGQHPQYPGFYPPPPQGWGRGGPPGPHGFPPMPYGGGPPGWYPGPQQGFPGAFPPYGGFPPGPPGHFQGPPQNQAPKPAPIGPGANKQASPTATQPAEKQPEKQAEPKSLAKIAEMPGTAVEQPPAPAATTTSAAPAAAPPSSSPTEVKATAPPLSTAQIAANAAAKPAPTGPKIANRIQPAVPLASPAVPKAPLQSQAGNVPPPSTTSKPVDPTPSLRDATQAATAAVAAAMAKLPPSGQANGSAVDNLQRKVNEMRVNDPVRAPRQPGGPNFGTGRSSRGGRGGPRGTAQKVDVPKTDFDFESANAKFNKQDLVKEAIAGSPLGETTPVTSEEAEVPASVYNKATSFFDNISSEAKERAEAGGNSRPGGREWRGEEQKKNLETFGQGSVDNGYRGGYRGRGRGRGGYRGRGYSGNGQPARGRGGYRGRGDAQTLV